MKDPRLVKLAKNLVNYSLELKKGEKIYIEWKGEWAKALAKELVLCSSECGGVPLWFDQDEAVMRQLIKNGTEEQIKEYGLLHLDIMKKMDAFLSIRGSDNMFDMADIPQEKMDLYRKYFWLPVHAEQRVKHTRWCVMRFPNNAMAQLAETSQEAFEDFYFNVCNLDYSKMSRAMDPLVELMQSTDKVRLVSPGTDLTFSIKGIPAIKCDGKLNIPDGEIFTAPVKNSINGTITYNAPALSQGVVYNNICLTFKDGKIISAKCDGDNVKLNKIFDADEGARYVGEFAIGVNPYITKPMKDTLFDEKIYGSIHLTPGACYDNASNGNDSSVHWDLVLIQTPEYGGGEMYFDDKLVRKNGEFLHPKLAKVLSANALK